MTRARREASDIDTRPRSSSRCYLAVAMGFFLLMALLGLVYEQRAVWVSGLGLFGLLCLQGACAHCVSRDLSRVAVINVVVDRPLRTSTL